MKIAIFGANGFLGRALSTYFTERGHKVLAIARRRTGCVPEVQFAAWDGVSIEDGWVSALEGTDAVINLAGRTVNCRYTDEHKREILESRVGTTELIGKALQGLQTPPAVWINTSTATIYEHREQGEGVVPHTEADGIIGDDFSMGVGKAWERAFFEDATPTRKVAARVSIVLGAERETVFRVLSKIVKLGLGGTMGKGNQMFSWIHEEDFCRTMEVMIENEKLSGPVNVASPEAVTNRELMQHLRETWNVPFGLPAAKWMLEIGTFVMRSETELVLKSRWVYPERLEEQGFTFTYPEMSEAFRELKARSV